MDTIKNTIKNFSKGLFKPNNKLSLIPNWLSFSRVIGGITIPIMAYTAAPLPLIFGNITFLALSDFLDGLTARTIAKEETKEGAMLDAVSDKIFSILLIIGILPVLPVFAINGLLEGTISIINGKLLAKGGQPSSNLLGKVKIWPLSIALGLGYLSLATGGINTMGLTSNLLMNISTAISLGTIPLQVINIKQYYEEYKKYTKQMNDDLDIDQNASAIEMTKSKEDELDLSKKNVKNDSEKNIQSADPKNLSHLKLSQERHQAIVYEIDKPQEKAKTNSKIYTKKNKH